MFIFMAQSTLCTCQQAQKEWKDLTSHYHVILNESPCHKITLEGGNNLQEEHFELIS